MTLTRDELVAMNPNYTEFKFPQIKPLADPSAPLIRAWLRHAPVGRVQ